MKKNIIISIIAALTIFTSTAFSASPSPTVKPSVSPTTADKASPSPKASNKPSSSPKAEEKTEETEIKTFPEPHSQAAILIDRKNGDILYEKNKSKRLYPASTTKIMTAVLALENGVLSDNVTATKEAIEPITFKHSHMGIKVGETLTLEQLMYGMLVYSANDAANVIATHIGGSLAGFTSMMNEKANTLGLSGTHFVNAHGYHEDDHYTTAEDLAKLTQYAMNNETFAEIVKTGMYRIPANEFYTEERVLSTTNHLISRYRNRDYFYQYAIGVKTGFTDEAGRCLVAAATKGSIELISVILKADDSSESGVMYAFDDTAKLYDYTFENYKYCLIASVDNVVSDSAVYEAKRGTRVALSPEENIEKLLPKDANLDEIVPEIVLNENIKAPITKGDVLGTVTYTYRTRVLGTTNLIAGNDVKQDLILAFLHLIWNILTSPFFFIPVLIIIYLILSANNRRKKRRQKRRSKLKYANQPKR